MYYKLVRKNRFALCPTTYATTFSLHSILSVPLAYELISRGDCDKKTYPYFSFNSFISGSFILEFIGARIPLSEIVPLRTCLTAVWHRMLAIPLFRNASGLRLGWRSKLVKGEPSGGNAPSLSEHCCRVRRKFRRWGKLANSARYAY